MTDDAFWTMERGFWLEGRAHYEAHWSPDAIAAFPMPAGIMAGDGFVADLPTNGSWEAVEIERRHLSRPAEDVAVLAYLGTGTRGGERHACICSSTYLERGGSWRMVQHQQTPAVPP